MKETTNRKLPMISVGGSHRQIGQQIGEAFRDNIHHGIANAHVLIDETYGQLRLNWEGAQIQAQKYLPYAEERYPQYVEELRGISEGSNANFTDILVVNALEGVTTDALHLTKCTSMAVNQERTSNRHVLAAHNEDWLPDDEPDVFLVKAKPENEPAFLAMTYGGLLPNIGFNEFGIAQCCDTVYPRDCRIGIPRIIVSRAVLAAELPSEAIRATVVPHRSAGYNHLLVHESGEIYNVEVSAKQVAVLYGEDGYLVHTNHYLDPMMRNVEEGSDELISTRVRYFRALRLLKQNNRHTISSLQNILRDHINNPDGICNHDFSNSQPMDREKTIVSLIMDLTERKMYAAWGNPCEHDYEVYGL